MIAEYPDRRFQVWFYTVSHATLLIRSPGLANESPNVDVAFYGVAFMSLSAQMHGLAVARIEADQHELRRYYKGEKPDELSVFRLSTPDVIDGIVVAGQCRHSENDVDRFDGGPLWPFANGTSLSPWPR